MCVQGQYQQMNPKLNPDPNINCNPIPNINTSTAQIVFQIALFTCVHMENIIIVRRAGTKNKLGAKQQAPKALGPRRRRRRCRGDKGAEIETLKASRGEVWGGGFPSPSD